LLPAIRHNPNELWHSEYAVLANHLHSLLRTRPDLVALWTDEECALRYRLAWPTWEDGEWGREPTDQMIEDLVADEEKMERVRVFLSSISGFMARVKEPLARMFNAQMDKKGHFVALRIWDFTQSIPATNGSGRRKTERQLALCVALPLWEARFGNRRIDSESDLIGCSFYVDLNHVKAGAADSLLDSEHSAIRDRMLSDQQREDWAMQNAFDSWELMRAAGAEPDGAQVEQDALHKLFKDSWLAPITHDAPLATTEMIRWSDSKDEPGEEETADAETADPPEAKPKDAAESAESSEAAPKRRSPGRPRKRRTKQILRRHRKNLDRRRKSTRCFIGIPWPQYRETVERLADAVIANRSSSDTIDALETTGDEWQMTAGSIRANVNEFVASVVSVIANLLGSGGQPGPSSSRPPPL
jgi:hypothetical protein